MVVRACITNCFTTGLAGRGGVEDRAAVPEYGGVRARV